MVLSAIRKYLFPVCLLVIAGQGNVTNATEGTVHDTGRVVATGISGQASSFASAHLLKEAYQRAGYQLDVIYLPAKRGLQTSAAGKVDAEISRIAGTDKRYPDLIAVPTPVSRVEVFAYSLKPVKPISKWSDLKPYRIGIRSGLQLLEKNTIGIERTLTRDDKQLFRLLLSGRIDLVVHTRSSAITAIRNHFYHDNIKVVSQPLFKTPLHHYVHRKQAHLVEKLDRQVSLMAQTGERELLYEEGLILYSEQDQGTDP